MDSQYSDWIALTRRIEVLEQQQRSMQETVQRLEHYLERLIQSDASQREDESALIASGESSQPHASTAAEAEAALLQFLQPLSADELLRRFRNGEREFSNMNLKGLDLNQWDLKKRGTSALIGINLSQSNLGSPKDVRIGKTKFIFIDLCQRLSPSALLVSQLVSSRTAKSTTANRTLSAASAVGNLCKSHKTKSLIRRAKP